jgi:hypothetical protein
MEQPNLYGEVRLLEIQRRRAAALHSPEASTSGAYRAAQAKPPFLHDVQRTLKFKLNHDVRMESYLTRDAHIQSWNHPSLLACPPAILSRYLKDTTSNRTLCLL